MFVMKGKELNWIKSKSSASRKTTAGKIYSDLKLKIPFGNCNYGQIRSVLYDMIYICEIHLYKLELNFRFSNHQKRLEIA